jgi:hypothetical protein
MLKRPAALAQQQPPLRLARWRWRVQFEKPPKLSGLTSRKTG